MSYTSAQHDRMLACTVMACRVVAVDLAAARVRVSDGDGWTSAWVRWHSQAAGKARHWRSPSMNEQGTLISPSGDPAQGTFIPGLYGNAGSQPDSRDHVEVWRFDDGGSLVYDWQANSYTITLPTGTVLVKVGSTSATLTDDAVAVKTVDFSVEATNITLKGSTNIVGPLSVTGDIAGAGKIMDAGGNSANHKH